MTLDPEVKRKLNEILAERIRSGGSLRLGAPISREDLDAARQADWPSDPNLVTTFRRYRQIGKTASIMRHDEIRRPTEPTDTPRHRCYNCSEPTMVLIQQDPERRYYCLVCAAVCRSDQPLVTLPKPERPAEGEWVWNDLLYRYDPSPREKDEPEPEPEP